MTGAAIGQLAHLLVAVSQFSAPGAGGADVWPGRRHALPPGVDPFTWSSYSIAPPVRVFSSFVLSLRRQCFFRGGVGA
jgi:hypothetical protein